MGRLLAIFLLMLPVACVPAAPPVGLTPTSSALVLRIANWGTYIEPGLIDRFAAETGAQIEYSTYGSSDEILAAVRARPQAYDLVVLTDYAVEMLRREGRLATLTAANLPNRVNLDPLFASPTYDPGGRHCVPYLWGTLGVGYNAARLARPIVTWADVFAQPASSVALLDSSRDMLGLALLALGHSPNSTNPREIAAAGAFLSDWSAGAATLAPDTGDALLVEGAVTVAVEWSGDIVRAAVDAPHLRYVVPAEGALIWTDSMCVLQDSPNQAIAERFINFMLEPEAGAALANYTHFSSPNRAAAVFINPEDRANPALYPDERTRRRLFFLVDVGQEVTALYDQSWALVLEAGR